MSPLSDFALMHPCLVGAGYVVAMCVSIKLGIVKQTSPPFTTRNWDIFPHVPPRPERTLETSLPTNTLFPEGAVMGQAWFAWFKRKRRI